MGDSELSFHDNVGQTVLDFEDQLAKENMTKEEGLDNVLRDSRLKVPLPDDKDYTKTSRGNNKLLFIYTDFEPDGMNSFRTPLDHWGFPMARAKNWVLCIRRKKHEKKRALSSPGSCE